MAFGHWGHGYATEAAAAWLEYGFETLDLSRVISVADPPNVRSISVMRKLGMRFDHEREIEEEGQVFPVVVYSITADRWRSREPG